MHADTVHKINAITVSIYSLPTAPRGQPFDMGTLREKLLNENNTKFGVPVPRESNIYFG